MPSIDLIRENLIPVCGRYKVKRAILFGSYANGTATDRSDIDIFVDSGLRGLMFFGLLEDVTDALQKPVDLIDQSQIDENSKVMDEINRTGVLIYGE